MTLSRLRNICTRSIIGWILGATVLFQIMNKAVFTHAHILPNGTVIVHAHLYNKNKEPLPVTKHTHTKNEFLLLSLQIFLFSFFHIFSFIAYKFFVKTHYIITNPCHINLAYSNIKNKAPPFA